MPDAGMALHGLRSRCGTATFGRAHPALTTRLRVCTIMPRSSRSAKEVVRCRHCGEPVTRCDELVVAGRFLVPVHRACYPAFSAALPWYHRGWPINSWRSFALYGALAAVLLLLDAKWLQQPGHGLALVLGAGAVWLLVGRAIAWFTIERRILAQGHRPR